MLCLRLCCCGTLAALTHFGHRAALPAPFLLCSGQQLALEPVLAAAYRQVALHFDDYFERWEQDWAAAMTDVPYSLVRWLVQSGACSTRNARGVLEFAWQWRTARHKCSEQVWDDICRNMAFWRMAPREVRDILDDPSMSRDAILLRRLGLSVFNRNPQLRPGLVAVDAGGFVDVSFVVPAYNIDVLLAECRVFPFGTQHVMNNTITLSWNWYVESACSQLTVRVPCRCCYFTRARSLIVLLVQVVH